MKKSFRQWLAFSDKRFRFAYISVAAFGVIKVLRFVSNFSGSPLVRDVKAYLEIARTLRHPFATTDREPILIWIVRLAESILGHEPLAMRIMGGAFFLMSGFLVFRVAKTLGLNRWIALVAMGLFFDNSFVAGIAVSGVRDIYFLVPLLWFAWVFSQGMTGAKWTERQLWALGLSLTFATGVRMSAYPLLACLAALVIWYRRAPKGIFKRLCLVVLAPILFMSPYLIDCRITKGDFLHGINVHSVWWRNYEFVTLKGQGCPECATPEEIKLKGHKTGTDPGATLDYIFKLRSPLQLMWDTLRGIAQLTLLPTDIFRRLLGQEGPLSLGFWLLSVMGYASMFWRRHLAWAWVIPVVTLFPLFFSYWVGMDWRIFSPLPPFLAIIAAAGLRPRS